MASATSRASVERTVERTDERWIGELFCRDEAAVADLRSYLRRGLHKVMAGRGVSESDVDDFVQEATVRVLDNLPGFRGESRFTTWAMAVAVRVALAALRRRRHLERREQTDPKVFEHAAATAAVAWDPTLPEAIRELFAELHRAIHADLTERQRAAVLGELAEVPSDVLAQRLGLTRNALYKLHHDARKKLRRAMTEAGFTPEQVRQTLAPATQE